MPRDPFHRAFNCIFGKVGHIAHANVVIELLNAKCLPCLYYGLEACPINKSHIKSLDFALNNVSRKVAPICNQVIMMFSMSVSYV